MSTMLRGYITLCLAIFREHDDQFFHQNPETADVELWVLHLGVMKKSPEGVNS